MTRVVVRRLTLDENSLARGLPFMTCDSFSTASDCSSLRLAGTSMTKR